MAPPAPPAPQFWGESAEQLFVGLGGSVMLRWGLARVWGLLRRLWGWLFGVGVRSGEIGRDDRLRGPHWRRITQVYGVLDRLYEQRGMQSYGVMIAVVRKETGVGCSRKLIRKWKGDRGYD